MKQMQRINTETNVLPLQPIRSFVDSDLYDMTGKYDDMPAFDELSQEESDELEKMCELSNLLLRQAI